MNTDITCEDLEAALKRLKRNKAAGVDRVRAEFILDATAILLGSLVQTFNEALDKGVLFMVCWPYPSHIQGWRSKCPRETAEALL